MRALGLPQGYTSGTAPPTSVEGFLYPATYSFDPGTKVSDALQQMITQFTDQARSTGFTADAKALKITPYQALIIASIAEKEAKVAADYPKVARVILNRIAAKMPLQIDATSAYAAKLKHLDRSDQGHLRDDRLAVQHLPQRRTAADADRQPRCARDDRRRAPGRGQLALLRQR